MKKRKAGRKDRYETHVKPNLDRIPAWRKQGLTEQQVAKRMDVAVSTLNVYKNQHPELVEALKKGREELVEELETSLYKKAMGFEYEEEKKIIEKDINGKDKKKVEKTTKLSLPDTGALAFALKNLAPDKWKDRRETNITATVDMEERAVDIAKYLKELDEDGEN